MSPPGGASDDLPGGAPGGTGSATGTGAPLKPGRPDSPGRSLLRISLGAVLIAATAVFLALAIARNWAQIAALDWSIRPLELLASVLLLIAAMAWGVFVWHRVIGRYEAPGLRFRTLLRIWFLSNLARYVPGKIWQFVGAVQLGRSAGVAPPVILTSMVIHTGLTLVSAALVSLFVLPTVLQELGPLSGAILLMAAASGLLAVHPAVLNFALGILPDRFSTQGLAWTGSWLDGIRLLALSTVAWIIYGLAFALFADSLVGIPLSMVPALVAANALAFLIGFLVLVTPGGLGAREAALTLLLGPLGSLGLAAVIAVAFRLWLVLGELAGAALVAALTGGPHAGDRSPTRSRPDQRRLSSDDPRA